jgi:hypothetical protein
MKTLFSNVALYVKSHVRLLFGYALIAALITVGGFTASLWLRNAEMKTDIANLNTSLVITKNTIEQLTFAATTQHRAISDLVTLRKLDSDALTGLASDVKVINAKDYRTRLQIQNLENQNEAVRNYLNSVIPADLVCVFDPAECPAPGAQDHPGGKGNPPVAAKGVSNPVRAAK